MLKLKPLNDSEKLKIFYTIRYSFLSDKEIVPLNSNPDFALAKEMIT